LCINSDVFRCAQNAGYAGVSLKRKDMEGLINQETIIPENKFVTVPCSSCHIDTRHKVLAETDLHLRDSSGTLDLWIQKQIIQCQGCLTVSFSKVSQFSEDIEHDPETGHEFIPEERTFYPRRIVGRSMLQDAHHLPRGVNSIYEEAHEALCADLRIMAGFGLRAIVEAICKDKSMSGRNLQKKIESLAESGHITASGTEILHSLRFMGNEAAHDMKAHTLKELNAGFDVVEYLLQGVYILPKQAENLPNRES
jgi:Domain of unknown function (DUF4145)